jgi:hypothetical protein
VSGGRPAPGAPRHGAARPGHAPAPSDEAVRRFVALSAALTGYDEAELWGTGMVETYLDVTWRAVGSRVLGDLLSAWDGLARSGGGEPPPERAVREALLAPATLGPVARNLVVLWYLGQWNQLPADWRDVHGADAADQTGIVSPEAYAQGLVWDAIGTHPQGAKMPGYGSWALPPKPLGGAGGPDVPGDPGDPEGGP